MDNYTSCEKCKYFVQHYLKDEFGRFKPIWGAGHCKNSELPYNLSKKIIKSGTPCGHFQPEEVKPQENKKTVLDKLKHAKLLLSDVTRILTED